MVPPWKLLKSTNKLDVEINSDEAHVVSNKYEV